jgi:hypothetical protein
MKKKHTIVDRHTGMTHRLDSLGLVQNLFAPVTHMGMKMYRLAIPLVDRVKVDALPFKRPKKHFSRMKIRQTKCRVVGLRRSEHDPL